MGEAIWWLSQLSLLFLASKLLESPRANFCPTVPEELRGIVQVGPFASALYTPERSRRFEIHRGPFASTIFASTFSRKRPSHRGENEFFSSYTSWILESDLWLQFGSVQEVDCWLLSGEILLVWLFSSGLTSIPQSLGTGLNFISGDRLTTAKRSIPSTARNRKRHQGNDEAVLPEKDAWNNQQL